MPLTSTAKAFSTNSSCHIPGWLPRLTGSYLINPRIPHITYLNIKKLNEEDAEVLGKIGVWIANDLVDEDTFVQLIKPESIVKSMCLIVLDLTRPSELKKSLNKWLTYAYNVINKLLVKFPYDKQSQIRKKGKKKY